MGRVLIDTSAWVEALRPRGKKAVRDAVRTTLLDGRACTCDLILLELWNGTSGSAEARMLRSLERELERADMDDRVWAAAMDLARRCRAAGVTVPSTDLVIAACATHHNLDLLHCDGHFENIARVG